LEWRLHPAAGYRIPAGLSHYDVWDQVTDALARDTDLGGIDLGTEHRTLRSLWDGLECFVAYDDDVEPAPLARSATIMLGRSPDAVGLVDHERIGSAWEAEHGATSLVEMLLAELSNARPIDPAP
jgi:hypothetical protein